LLLPPACTSYGIESSTITHFSDELEKHLRKKTAEKFGNKKRNISTAAAEAILNWLK